jgi:hypothetical protein
MGNDHFTFGNQVIHHRDSLRQKTARIAAEIQHQTFQMILIERFHAIFEFTTGRLIELFDVDITNAGLQGENLRNTLPADLIANDVEYDRLLDPFAGNLDLYRGSLRTF